jgi:diguanylate cyclase (GGDEF)-like protein
MALGRVYVHNLPTEFVQQLSELFADYRLQIVSQPPADAAVVGIETVDEMADLVARFAADSTMLHVPIIAVGGPDSPRAWEAAVGTVQAYVPDSDPHRIAGAVRMICDTVRSFAAVHPLTGLPGSPALYREIEARLRMNVPVAVVQFDLDNFKPYNDVYGYQRGDAMLLWLKGLIHEVIAECKPEHWFLAHLGGDDFVLTIDLSSARMVAQRVIERFEAERELFFTEEHCQAGGFVATTRSGASRQLPLTTLTAVMVTNEASDITHPGHISAVLAEIKSYAKSLPGSNLSIDERREHWLEPIPRGNGTMECSGNRRNDL